MVETGAQISASSVTNDQLTQNYFAQYLNFHLRHYIFSEQR